MNYQNAKRSKCNSWRSVPVSKSQLRICHCQCHIAFNIQWNVTYCCSEIVSCSRCLVPVPGSYRRFSSRRPAAPKTRSLAADDAGMQRIRRASENILDSKLTVRLSRKKSIMSTPLLTFILTYQKVHGAVRCDATVFYWLAFASSRPMGILAHMKK